LAGSSVTERNRTRVRHAAAPSSTWLTT